MRLLLQKWFKHVLYQLVYLPGDTEDTVLLKKIWWIFVASFVLFPSVEVIFGFFEGEKDVVILSGIVVVFSSLLLVIFHFYRKNIETYGLVFQLLVVAVTSVKTILTGGLIYSAGVVYVGLVGPIQAIIFPNKKRAIAVFALYIIAVIGGTLAQPYIWPGYKAPDLFFIETYITKFVFGTFFVFFALNYFTAQLQKMKAAEVGRMKELDDLKTRFYTNITHEFRTPLSIILGMADQVKREPEQWLEEGTRLIKSNGIRLLALVNQMLDLSKLEARAMPITMVHDDIVAYIRHLSESFHLIATQKQIELIFKSVRPQFDMDLDPEKISNIFSNLLSNAIKFTPEGGKIEIQLNVEGSNGSEVLLLSVRDTGIGIPPHLLNRVFDRYFQVESHSTPATAGTGLGLALSKEMAQLMGGRIRLESKVGEGSIFTLILPITHLSTARHTEIQNKLPTSGTDHYFLSQTGNIHEPEEGKSLKLLLVEDNPDAVRYLQGLLSPYHHIAVAYDGAAGWKLALEQVPDLIISDVMMPEMDGFELCSRLKKDIRTSHIPIILLTAKADMPSKLEGLERGADVYLAKPFDREELLVHVRKLIELRKALQEHFKNFGHEDAERPVEERKQEHAFLQKVRHALEAHLAEEEFGVEQLCRTLGMSRSQLYRKFQALTNTTVHQFLQEIRLYKAKELLTTTKLTVTDVAFEVGFKNLSHFSRVFSEAWGTPPGKIRGKKTLWDD
ncbi:ATP-binding protein [Haliscomenobacter sp.]|uniref:hybrid sensor histidine kinase/response regulator transcription factor n=1 Tax=Haliscomenobacter sp. TaxID=2717303 RepID=UPI003BACB92F